MAEQKGKYRAWDKANNQYVPKSFIDQLFLNMDGRVIRYSVFGFTDVTDKFDIEFSIGRYDKHGKEIYEGDELDGGFNALCGGDVFWDDEDLAFYTCNYHAQALPIRDTSGTEITGNIHVGDHFVAAPPEIPY